jgi:head-tail adaptor
MRAPVLDQQLTVQRGTRTADGQGGYAIVWATVFTLWAEAREGGGGEGSRPGDRIEATGSVRFTFNRVDADGLLESDRVLWDGVTYNIDHIAAGQRAVYRVMTCTRGKAT